MRLIPLELETILTQLRSNNSFILVDGAPVWGDWHDDEFDLLAKRIVKDSSGGEHKLEYKDGEWSVTYPIVGETYTPCYPYYYQGTIREVVAEVNKASSSKVTFPLLMCVTTSEKYVPVTDQFYSYDLKMYLCADSSREYTSKDREVISYQDKLLPIMVMIERYFNYNGLLSEDFSPNLIPKWGKQGLYGVDGNVFTEMTEAIDIETTVTFNINCN